MESSFQRSRSVSQVLRMSGEVSAYKQNQSSPLESSSSHCQQPSSPASSMGKCPMGGKCSYKFAKCIRCGNDETSLFGSPFFFSKKQCRQLESQDVASKTKRPSSRSSGELAVYNKIPDIKECLHSRDGLHHWRFGRCSYCQKSEGRIVHDLGTMANPGFGEAGCAKGGKCMFKFAKCTKCGRNELERHPSPMVQGSSPEESDQEAEVSQKRMSQVRRVSGEFEVSKKRLSQARRVSGDDRTGKRFSTLSMENESICQHSPRPHASSALLKQRRESIGHTKLDVDDERYLPVGGGLRAVRRLSCAHSNGGSDGSTTAGSDDEGPMTKSPSESSTDSALWDTFRAFSGPSNDMDGKHFAKLCKDCELLDKSFTGTDVDIVFAKAMKGRRRVSWSSFEDLLGLVAERKGITHAAILSLVSKSRGPILHGTCPETVRFHDDKTTYTGTHVYGGPEAVSKI